MKRLAWRRVSLALGLALFLAGAAILGVGLFSYFNGEDGGDASPYLSAYFAGDEGIYDRPVNETPTAGPTQAPPAEAAPQPPIPREIPYRMIIDALGVNGPVLAFGLDGNGVPQVPLNGSDVAWYDFSAEPGTGSNAVFAGHVNWARAPGVFANIEDLAVGDVIRLVADDGTELVYSVSDNFQVDPDDPTALQVMGATPTDTITLITCGGRWIPNPSEQFGGDYTNRVIVRATLVSIETVGAGGGPASGG